MIYKIKRGCSFEAATQASTWTQAPDLELKIISVADNASKCIEVRNDSKEQAVRKHMLRACIEGQS